MRSDIGGGRATAGWSGPWQDWCNLALAIWLFISPWAVNFGGNPADWGGATPGPVNDVAAAASWNAWVAGVILFLLAASALSRLEIWQEWACLALGVWLFVAPWVLGFTQLSAAAWNHWVVGVLIALISICDLSSVGRTASAEPGYAGMKPDRRRP
jgi:hypothetical protein